MTDDVMSGGRFAAPNRTGDMVIRKAGAVSATEPSLTKGDWMQRIAILGASGAGKTVGRVAEIGSHDELMAAGGGYARLFRLQAAGYQTGTSPARPESR